MTGSFPLRRGLVVALLLAGACSSSDESRLTLTDETTSTMDVDSDAGSSGRRSSTTEVEKTSTTTSTSVVTTTTSRPITTVAPPPPPTAAAPLANGTTVTRVIDGDTFEVRIGGGVDKVRIIGINSPESDECMGAEAGAWLRDRIGGRQVVLVSDQTDRDQYGRLLRYVELDGDVGVGIVRAGLALANRYPPDTARADALETAQRAAKDAGVGMWNPSACGASQGADVVISEIRFDADGNDNDNKNDEWVRITNAGSARAVLTGWVLKDESASHRYHYPDGFTLQAGASVTVRTGCGTNTASDLYWCKSGSAVWNNSGDTAFLLDPAGNVVDSRSGP